MIARKNNDRENNRGTTVNAMSIKHKNSEYRRFTDERDIHFIFEEFVEAQEKYEVLKRE